MTHEIESPCTGVCQLDERQVCKGCYRSMDEIIEWAAADTQTRLRILDHARQRKPDSAG